MENNALSIHQSRSFWLQWLVQLVQLTTIDLTVDSLIRIQELEVNDTEHIPPNAKHDFFRMKTRFCGRNRCLARAQLLLLLSNVHIKNPILITGENSIDKRVLFVAREQWFAYGGALHFVDKLELVWYPNAESIHFVDLVKMVSNRFMATVEPLIQLTSGKWGSA